MSGIIDRTLVQKVRDYDSGRLDLPSLTSQIQASRDPKALVGSLMEQIFKAFNKERNDLNVKDTPTMRTLYNTLCELHEQNLAIATVKSVAAQHIVATSHAASKAVQLTTGMLLSELFASTSQTLTAANFAPIQSVRTDKSPLALTLSSNSPNIGQSLENAQKALGPIAHLTIDFDFSNDELCSILNACPKLTSLTLIHPLCFTDSVVEGVKWPQTISTLDIKDSSITKTGLQELCDRCTELRSLDLRGCPGISHIDMMQVQYPALLVDFACDAFWESDIVLMDEEEDEVDSAKPPRDCEKEFKEICKLAAIQKESPVALTIAAMALLESLEDEKAQGSTWLMAALECNGQFLPATVALKELQRQGAYQVKANPKEAEQNLDNRLNEFKEHPQALACKARFLLDQSELEEAHIIARFAYHKDNRDDFVLATMAEVCRRMSHPVLASEFCNRALDSNPRNVYALNTLAALKNEYAIRLYKDVRKISCYNPSACLGLAELYLAQNKPETNLEAITLLNTVLSVNKDSAEAHFALAKAYIRSDLQGVAYNAPLAISHAEAAMKAAKSNPALLAAIDEKFASASIDGEAQDKKRLIKEEDASSAQGSVKKNKPAEAESENHSVFISSDEIVANTQEHVRALQRCELAFSKKPDDLCSLVMLGELLLPIDPDRGRSCLEYVLGQNGDYVKDACIALANYYGVYSDKTKKLLEHAWNIDNSDLRVNLALAKLALLSTDDDIAQKLVSAALEKNNLNPRALVLQAMLQLARKEVAEAAATIEDILANTEFGNITRIDIMVLLCENPDLLGNKRHQALKLLFPA